jgi:periplasmic protein TonB
MRLVNLAKSLFVLPLILSSALLRAEPMLNGISSHSELGQEQFIGALFSETISNNADTLLSATQPMRIEMKVLSNDGISARRFSRMWIDGMAINNSPSVLTEQANNIVKLDSLFKGRLVKGDHVVFKLTPSKGVEISVNKVMLGNIANDQFFSLLLSSWIGKVPLSSEFKDNMLKVGDVGLSLRSRFDQIQPASQRVADVSTWAGQAQSSAASSSARSSSARSSIAIEVDVPKPVITLPPISGAEETSSSQAASVARSVAVASSAASKPMDEEEDEDAGPAFTTQSLLARQFYVKEVIKLINKRVRYPAPAAQKGQEGSVRVSVTLDRQGNIISITATEPSKFNILTKEALAAIERAAPFPALPPELPGNTFNFTAPIRFTLMQSPKK